MSQSPTTVKVVYAGNSNFTTSASSTLDETVGLGSTQVVITSSAPTAVSAKAVSFTGVVSAASPSTGFPTGTVTWTITGKSGDSIGCTTSNDTVNKKTGKVTCRVAAHNLYAADSPYTVKAAYGGDANFAAASGSLSQALSPVSSKVKLSGLYGVGDGGVAAFDHGHGVGDAGVGRHPTGTVTFAITPTNGTAPTCTGGDTVTLSAASATCSIPGGFAVDRVGPTR